MGMLLNIEYPGMKNGTKMSHFGFELQNHRTIKIVQFGCCRGGLFRIGMFIDFFSTKTILGAMIGCTVPSIKCAIP